MQTEQAEDIEVWRGRPAWSTYALLWVFVTILVIRALVSLRMGYGESLLFHGAAVGMLAGLAVLLRQTTLYRITRRGVYQTRGWVGGGERLIPMDAIESVTRVQGPLERAFGSGDVILQLKTGITERISGVKDPEVVCNKIRAMI